ncbi:hypothetical protein [Haloferula sp. BvORR071]|uniref:hypothetical protein n=1 Tax=Haloferula sp. BvORR071 TaxID=1396141 RepID=UPI002240F9E2|nr:hypothetical protein [Haloferula sp. BvORR071]
MPIVIAGGSKAGLNNGSHEVYEQGTPLCALWLGMLEKAGVKVKDLGDANGVLKGLG